MLPEFYYLDWTINVRKMMVQDEGNKPEARERVPEVRRVKDEGRVAKDEVNYKAEGRSEEAGDLVVGGE